jgi:hypothetical protein
MIAREWKARKEGALMNNDERLTDNYCNAIRF